MAAYIGEDLGYLKLCDNPRTFKPTAPTTNVFFDNTNGQIFSVELGDETKISVKGRTDEDSFEFKIKDKGIVKSIKFSPNNHILALQRTRNSIEFIAMVNREPNSFETVQHSKGKNNKIYGFEWVNNKEIVFITEQSIEIYEVDGNNVKLIKSMNINSHWFVYDYKTKMLLLSTGGNYNNILQPLQLQSCGEINKLSRFEIELVNASSPMSSQPLTPSKLLVLEEDVVLTYLYHLPRILIIRHQQRGSSSTQVIVYTVYKYKTVKRTHTLELSSQSDGKFALNIVDNLIIVHHKSSRSSMIFDILLSNDSTSGGIVSYKLPVCEGKSIRSLKDYENYSSNWVMFEPDIIIDVKKGLLFTLQLDMPALAAQFKSNRLLFEFLILRNMEQEHVLSLLRRVFLEAEEYGEMVQFIEMINFYYEQYLNYQVQINTGKSVKLISLPDLSPQENSLDSVAYLNYNYTRRIIISPALLYDTIFIRLNEDKSKHTLLVALLIEFIKSLIDHNVVDIDYCIYELLLKTLIYQKKYYQLHQILQYYIVKDSKQIACLLLPLEKLYPPAYQLALDMLERLRAQDEINHILLYKPANLVTALRRNAKSDADLRTLARKLLELSSKLAESATKTADNCRSPTEISESCRSSTGSTDLSRGSTQLPDSLRSCAETDEEHRARVVFWSVYRFYEQYCRQYDLKLMRDQKCFKYVEAFETLFKE